MAPWYLLAALDQFRFYTEALALGDPERATLIGTIGVTTVVQVHFLPENCTVSCEAGDLIYDVATAAGIFIPTGCLMGSCHACEVELAGGERVCSCITPVGSGPLIAVYLLTDPTW
nr:2Fe-2S iron-sulfur cluster binding domain-containing protein [Candidatus Cyanaurora vandensis]